MVSFYRGIETKPYLVALNQIEVFAQDSGTSKDTLANVSSHLKDWGFNFSIPIACLTDEEEKYHLLTGLPIYQAAIAADLERLWIFIIAAEKSVAEKAIAQIILQSKLNEIVIDPQDVREFIEILNNKRYDLTLIPGIKSGYAKLIAEHRPYTSLEDIQKKLGVKRSLNWLKSYKQTKIYPQDITEQDVKEFIEFLNNTNSDLTSIPGIKSGYAKLIRARRSYKSLEDLKNKLGPKRCLNWLRAYKKIKENATITDVST
ncbi:hypothetical protein [Microseira sp. BLCC-F43]|jgi:DNA uptake protein ComE-like DNA-binding protein|uniref:hypothetical protein n=1 Tax=Microseira sp. BLCC-F43 TaxID=3153602 RepID=UPI0035B7104D